MSILFSSQSTCSLSRWGVVALTLGLSFNLWGCNDHSASAAMNSSVQQRASNYSSPATAGGDNTQCVLDNGTGLVWEGKTNERDSPRSGKTIFTNQFAGYAGSNLAAPTDAADYVSYVNRKGLCGFTDWRMPTVRELQTIVAPVDPAWFPNTQGVFYWSSDGYPSVPAYAWLVTASNGLVKESFRISSYAVRLVRGSSSHN